MKTLRANVNYQKGNPLLKVLLQVSLFNCDYNILQKLKILLQQLCLQQMKSKKLKMKTGFTITTRQNLL